MMSRRLFCNKTLPDLRRRQLEMTTSDNSPRSKIGSKRRASMQSSELNSIKLKPQLLRTRLRLDLKTMELIEKKKLEELNLKLESLRLRERRKKNRPSSLKSRKSSRKSTLELLPSK